MHKRLNGMIICFLYMAAVQSVAKQAVVSDLKTVLQLAQDQVRQHGAEHVLVVFDIDNTLLASRVSLGSDQWYEWQSNLIKKGNQNHSVATGISGLIKIQSMLYSLGDMRETQEDTDVIVRKIQNLGVKVIALTARGPQNRDATLRELEVVGIDLQKKPVGPGSIAGRFYPVMPDQNQLSGLSLEEVKRFFPHSPRQVAYENGVLMVSGQHKGAMLRVLLHRTQERPKSILFVDDKMKNVQQMSEGFQSTSVSLLAIRYTGEDKNVSSFHKSDKTRVNADWQELSHALKRVFPTSLSGQ